MSNNLTEKRIALMGWSLPSMEAADKLKKPFVVVSLPDFEEYAQEHDIPFVGWDYDRNLSHEQVYEKSGELHEKLQEKNVHAAIPIFEETVEWAGALNSRINNNPRIFNQSLLFRNKPMMKRKAHLGGLEVGLFEEGTCKEDVLRFFKRVNEIALKENGEVDPIHVKALDKAGSVGHRVIHSPEDVETKLNDDSFPCLLESHLEGIEFSCEAFIYKKKILFLNITEYVVFGYSMMAPPTKRIEEKRPEIRKKVQQVVDAFDIDYGVIHPEFFLNDNDRLYFGEVAYRIPGGHIFELIQRTYNFNPFQAHILCCDPETKKEELENVFPQESDFNGHAGSFLVYPRVKTIQGVNIPRELEDHCCFDKHTLFAPVEGKVQDGEGYGNHYGTIFFYNDDCDEVKESLRCYLDHDFYI